MNDQLPPALDIVVPSDVVPSNTSTVVLGSAEPIIVGVSSVVLELLAGDVITGAFGIVVSISTVTEFEELLILPALSEAIAKNICDPSDNGLIGVNDHAPLPSAIVVPNRLFPSIRMVTVELASAIPDTEGVLSLVIELLDGELITGGFGITVSIVTFTMLENGLRTELKVALEMN